MKKIVRKAYCNYIETYELKLDETLLKQVNERLKDELAENQDNIVLTIEDLEAIASCGIKGACEFEMGDKYTKKYDFYYWAKEHTYKSTIYDWTLSILDEYTWDTPYNAEFEETNSWDNFLVED